MKRQFSIAEAAKVLGVTGRTVWNYVGRGELKTYKLKTGSCQAYIEYLSLRKCMIRHIAPWIYWGRDRMIKDLISQSIENAHTKVILKEMGLEDMGDTLDDLFSFSDTELDTLIDKHTEYWDKYDVAAYMEVSLTTVKKMIRGKLLVPVKEEQDGRKLFSNFDVMELYQKLHTEENREGQTEEDDTKDNESIKVLYDYIMNHQEVIPHLPEILDDL